MSPSQKTLLQSLASSRTGSGAVALRERMMLLAGKGESNCQIVIRFDVKAHTVGTWRARFEADGCEELYDLQRTGLLRILLRPRSKRSLTRCVASRPPVWGVGVCAVSQTIMESTATPFITPSSRMIFNRTDSEPSTTAPIRVSRRSCRMSSDFT